LPQPVRCSLNFSLPWCTGWLNSGLSCIHLKMGNSFSTMLKRNKQQEVTKISAYENETPIRIQRWLLTIYGEETVD
jgi:hypothetical protein